MNVDPHLAMSRSDPYRLATLMSSEPPGSQWDPAEIAALLQHQLGTPLSCAFGEQAESNLLGQSTTFLDLLHDSHPPLVLLEKIRTNAKETMSSTVGSIPPEVAGVFYYGSILLARLRLNARISALDDHSLVQGIQQLLAQPWLDDATRSFLREAVQRLETL